MEHYRYNIILDYDEEGKQINLNHIFSLNNLPQIGSEININSMGIYKVLNIQYYINDEKKITTAYIYVIRR